MAFELNKILYCNSLKVETDENCHDMMYVVKAGRGMVAEWETKSNPCSGSAKYIWMGGAERVHPRVLRQPSRSNGAGRDR